MRSPAGERRRQILLHRDNGFFQGVQVGSTEASRQQGVILSHHKISSLLRTGRKNAAANAAALSDFIVAFPVEFVNRIFAALLRPDTLPRRELKRQQRGSRLVNAAANQPHSQGFQPDIQEK